MTLHIAFLPVHSHKAGAPIRFPATEIDLAEETSVVVVSLLSGTDRATVEQPGFAGPNKPFSYLATPDGETFHVRSGTPGDRLGFGRPQESLKLPMVRWSSVLPGLHVMAPSGENDEDGQDVWRLGSVVVIPTHEGDGVLPGSRASRMLSHEAPGGQPLRGFARFAGLAPDETPWWLFADPRATHEMGPFPGAPFAPIDARCAGLYVVELPDGRWTTVEVLGPTANGSSAPASGG